MTWIMLIISIATGTVQARIPYPTQADCMHDALYAQAGNVKDTVKVVCKPAWEV